MSDEFIDEINAIRRQMMEECGHDLKKLGELIKRSQEEDPDNLVSEVPPTETEPAGKAER
jgi:hypothetical protein